MVASACHAQPSPDDAANRWYPAESTFAVTTSSPAGTRPESTLGAALPAAALPPAALPPADAAAAEPAPDAAACAAGTAARETMLRTATATASRRYPGPRRAGVRRRPRASTGRPRRRRPVVAAPHPGRRRWIGFMPSSKRDRPSASQRSAIHLEGIPSAVVIQRALRALFDLGPDVCPGVDPYVSGPAGLAIHLRAHNEIPRVTGAAPPGDRVAGQPATDSHRRAIRQLTVDRAARLDAGRGTHVHAGAGHDPAGLATGQSRALVTG